MSSHNLLASSETMLESSNVVMDMRQAVFNRAPLAYRLGSSTLHVQTRFVTVVALLGLSLLVFLFITLPGYPISRNKLTTNLVSHGEEHGHGHRTQNWFTVYNSTYPLTAPIFSGRGFIKYRIAIISDLDTNSKHVKLENTWISYLKKGYLTMNIEKHTVSDIEWDSETITLSSHMAYGGRGMELSELVVFNGKLYSLDDRTGIIYEICLTTFKAIPWVILTDGDGSESKGFKAEWCTVKDETLIVGGLGKEWTNSEGEVLNHNPQWVKTVTPHGYVQHHDWSANYEKLKQAEKISSPGYMIHESCVWSNVRQEWIFLPRRASREAYFDEADEHRATNLMLEASEGFENIKVTHVGDVNPTHGFSSFKPIPGTNDNLFIALKSEEVSGKVASYVIVFDIKGNIIYPEKKIGDLKFEGIEFI